MVAIPRAPERILLFVTGPFYLPMLTEPSQIAKYIDDLREQKGCSVAELCRCCGIERATYYNFMNGETDVRLGFICRAFQFLQVSWLVRGMTSSPLIFRPECAEMMIAQVEAGCSLEDIAVAFHCLPSTVKSLVRMYHEQNFKATNYIRRLKG